MTTTEPENTIREINRTADTYSDLLEDEALRRAWNDKFPDAPVEAGDEEQPVEGLGAKSEPPAIPLLQGTDEFNELTSRTDSQ